MVLSFAQKKQPWSPWPRKARSQSQWTNNKTTLSCLVKYYIWSHAIKLCFWHMTLMTFLQLTPHRPRIGDMRHLRMKTRLDVVTRTCHEVVKGTRPVAKNGGVFSTPWNGAKVIVGNRNVYIYIYVYIYIKYDIICIYIYITCLKF